MGIIAGLGRGMPSRPAGGRGGRWSSPTTGRAAGARAHALRRAERVVAGARGAGTCGRGPGLKRGASSDSGASPGGSVSASVGRRPSGRLVRVRLRSGSLRLRRNCGLRATSASASGSASMVGGAAGFAAAVAAGASTGVSAGAPSASVAVFWAAAFFAGAFLAAFLAAAASFLASSSSPYLSWNRFTTGGSTLDEGAFTYSPRSVSIVITSALLTPYSLASSETRTLATWFLLVRVPEGYGPLAGVHAHRAVLIAMGLIAGS